MAFSDQDQYREIKEFCENQHLYVPNMVVQVCRSITILDMPGEVANRPNRSEDGFITRPENGILISRSTITQEEFIEVILQIIKYLPFIEVLKIQALTNITELPEFLFTGLPSLSALFLTSCKNVGPLPKNIGHIAGNLNTLVIYGCPLAICLPPSIGILDDLNSHMEYWSSRNMDEINLKRQLFLLKKNYKTYLQMSFTVLLCAQQKNGDIDLGVDDLGSKNVIHLPMEMWEEIALFMMQDYVNI